MGVIFSAVFVFVFSQFLLECFIKPLNDHRVLIADIATELLFQSNNLYSNLPRAQMTQEDIQERHKVQDNFRLFASRLGATTTRVWGYTILSSFNLVPTDENINKASKEMFGLSNGVFEQYSAGEQDIQHERADTIRRLLNIRI